MKGNEYIIDRFWKSCFYIKKPKLNNEEDTVWEKERLMQKHPKEAVNVSMETVKEWINEAVRPE